MDLDGERVVREVFLASCDRPVLFVKNMGHHLIDLDWGFLEEVTNVMLIRDPKEMLPSLINQVPEPDIDDTALKRQVEIFAYLRHLRNTPLVLDSRELLLNPQGVLEQFCQTLGLTFEAGMLHWEANARPEDGIWAPHWYHAVHQSTGFAPYRPKTKPFPAFLKPLLEECQSYYDYLYARAIKA